MFTIFGGATAFTQWQKDQKVTNPNMTAGDPVYFAASNGESYPTRAYISGGDVVADVPNELLTMHKPFTARLDDHDEPVTIFRVEAADKPSGYVYEDNMNKTHAPGDVVIPAGATLTLEEGAKVNDKAGVLAMAGSPSEVVILPETVLPVEDDAASIMTPWSVEPVAGGVYSVKLDGASYECAGVAGSFGGAPAVAMGNSEFLSQMGFADAPENDAPFALICNSNENGASVGIYGVCMLNDDRTSVTLSIVQVGAASGGGSASAGGGGFLINATMTSMDEATMQMSFTMDKSFAETLAAIKAGQYVSCHAPVEGNTVFTVSVYMDDAIVFLCIMNTTSYLKLIFSADESAVCNIYNE